MRLDANEILAKERRTSPGTAGTGPASGARSIQCIHLNIGWLPSDSKFYLAKRAAAKAQRLLNTFQELAAQHAERDRVVRKPILQLCAFCDERQFLAQVTEPQALVNAS